MAKGNGVQKRRHPQQQQVVASKLSKFIAHNSTVLAASPFRNKADTRLGRRVAASSSTESGNSSSSAGVAAREDTSVSFGRPPLVMAIGNLL